MDENYYKELIDNVNRNEQVMWGGTDEPNDGYEDFKMLWGLLFDEDAKLSPQTYFEAIELCLNSFFGTMQDPDPIWRNIARNYEIALNSSSEKDVFKGEFAYFMSHLTSSISNMEAFYDLMRLAIDDKDPDMATLLVNHSPIEIENYDQLEEDYPNNPEWAAYIEGLTDIEYDNLPSDPIFIETIKKLYSKFGHFHNMDKLVNLYHRYY